MAATPLSLPPPASPRLLRRHVGSLIVAVVLAVQAVAVAPAGALAAQIAFRAATSASGSSTTTLQVSTPPGTAAGDALLASVSVRGKPNIRQPSGWTLVLKTQLSSTLTQAVYVRIAGGSEPATSTWTFSKAVAAAAGVLAYAGVDPAAPVDVAKGQTNAASTQITAPSITTTSDGDVLVGFFAIAQATAITPESALLERYEATSTGTFRITQAGADQLLSAAGATGPRTATAGASGASIGQLVALRPAVEPPADTTEPAVTATSPGNGASGVAVGANVSATFSESVTGVSGTTFTLAASDGTPIPASVTYAAATRTATLDPAAGLEPGVTYSAALSSGIADEAGNALSPTSWTFETASTPPPPPPPPPPGSIAFRSVSSGFNTETASIVLPRPTGVMAGDVLIAVVTTRSVPVIPAPSGWSTVIETKNQTIMQQLVFIHVAGSSEPASYTFSFAKAVSATGGIIAYSGVDPISPIDGSAGSISASSATVTAPSLTTTTDNAMLVALFGMARLTSFTEPAAMNERFDVSGSSSVTYKVSSAADDAPLGTAGPTGSRSATAAGAAGNVGQLVALRAAGAPAVADFDGVPLSGIAPLTVSFQDRSTGSLSSWAWDFDGDQQTDSIARNPTHTYTDPGTYTVGLTIANGETSDTEVKTAYVVVDPVPTSSPTDPTIVGAGDIADCNATADEATATLLDGIAGTVFTLGDNVYETGTAAEWNNCYDPTWGRHRARTRPSIGDHDHPTASSATEYFDYFGAAAGDPSRGYYSYDQGAWHIVVLNTECALAGGCGAGSPQEAWLRQDLAANSSACTLAYWHNPLYSSAKGGAASALAFWDALLDDGADVVLNGDSHVYERFAPQDDRGNGLATGIRQFIVGTGGRSLGGFRTPVANSEVRNSTTQGVLKLTLHASGYSWEFVPVAGSSFRDSGVAACH